MFLSGSFEGETSWFRADTGLGTTKHKPLDIPRPYQVGGNTLKGAKTNHYITMTFFAFLLEKAATHSAAVAAIAHPVLQ